MKNENIVCWMMIYSTRWCHVTLVIYGTCFLRVIKTVERLCNCFVGCTWLGFDNFTSHVLSWWNFLNYTSMFIVKL